MLNYDMISDVVLILGILFFSLFSEVMKLGLLLVVCVFNVWNWFSFFLIVWLVVVKVYLLVLGMIVIFLGFVFVVCDGLKILNENWGIWLLNCDSGKFLKMI